jgi:hypothetical protein
MPVTLSARPATLRRRARRSVLLALLPLALGSCLFGRGSRDEPTVTVRVRNNLVPTSALTISLIPTTGSRQVIGTVDASSTSELRFTSSSTGDPHRLLAEASNGTATASRLFTLATAETVEWNVGTNTLNVQARR